MKKKSFDILLVEDNPGDARLVEEYLTRADDYDFNMEQVRSLQEAISHLGERDADVVLLDLGLPDSLGIETFHIIHAQKKNIPVLILTSLENEELALKIVQAGAQDYLVKDHMDEVSLPRAVRYAIEMADIQQELEERERQLRTLLGSLQGMVYRCFNEPLWSMVFVSEGAKSLTGYEPEEIRAGGTVNYGEIIHPQDRDKVWEVVQEAVEWDRSFQIQYRIRTKGGQVKWVWEEGKAIGERDGQLMLEGYISDITERVESKKALGKSELRYRLLAETAQDYIVVHDLKGRITYINQAGLAFSGYTEDEIHHQPVSVFISGDQIDRFKERQEQRESGDQSRYLYKTEFINKEGVRVPVEVSSSPIVRHGKVNSVLLVARDIRGRVEAEKALRESEEKFRSLVDQAAEMLFLHDLEGEILEVNEAAIRNTGYSREKLENLCIFDIDPDAQDRIDNRGYWRSLIPEDPPVTFEARHKRKDGSVYPAEVTVSKVVLQNGEFILALARDITDRKEAERALKEREEKYRRFFQTSQDCVFITSKEGRWLEMNQAAVELFGYESKEELADINVWDLYADPVKRQLHLLEIESKGFAKDFPVDLCKEDGSIIHTRISSTLYYQEGEHIGYQGTIRDITELVRHIKEIKHQSNQLNALREISLHLVSELDVGELLEDTVAYAVALAEGEGGCFYLVSPEGDGLEMSVRMGYPSLPAETTIHRGEGLVGHVWAKGEKVLIEDYAAWEGHAPQWVDHLGHRALIGVPVKWRDEWLGVFEVIRDAGRPFSEDNAWLLELFANQAAAAIRNARVFDHSEQRLRRLQSLQEIDQAISGSLDIKTTLNIVVDRMIESLEVDAGAVLLYRPHLQQLEYVSGTGFRTDEVTQTKYRLGEDFAGKVAVQRQIIHVSDLALETVRLKYGETIRKKVLKLIAAYR
ncbi:MAG: PAS domain S-box protein [Anaerolineales bacterium]|nr:PAS domain S-box protein [Anaerolineales bacterium]